LSNFVGSAQRPRQTVIRVPMFVADIDAVWEMSVIKQTIYLTLASFWQSFFDH
jgi:hypothetical protein